MIATPLFPELINLLEQGTYQTEKGIIQLGTVQGAEIFHNIGDSTFIDQLTFFHKLLGDPQHQTFGFQYSDDKVIQINGVCSYEDAASMAILTDIPNTPFTAKGFLSFQHGSLEYRYGDEKYLILYPFEGESYSIPLGTKQFQENHIDESVLWAEEVWENQ